MSTDTKEVATPELTAKSTHEDVLAKVDEVIASRSDSEKIAEDTEADINAEDKSGDDTVHEDETITEEETSDWLDDKLKAEVAAYGIDEKELSEFTSREELDRALRFLNRSALETGRKALSKKGSEQTEKKPDEEADEKPDEKPEKKSGYKVELDDGEDGFDERLVDEMTRMSEHYESRLSAMEASIAENDAIAEEQKFDGIVDSLGHADLFGKTGKESPKESKRRDDLIFAARAYKLGLEGLGVPADMNDELVGRVASMVFAEELGKKALKNRTRKIADQADKRMGGTATKPHDSTEPLREEMRREYKRREEAGS